MGSADVRQKNGHTYQNIAQALVDQRTDTLFGLMGDANLFMVDHFVRNLSGRFVPVAYEGSAVLMALAYARVSGKPGVATVTHGPALTNCITALVEGVRAQLPMVLLAGDTPVSDIHNLQNIDQSEVVRVTGAGFVQIRTAQTVTADIAEAFYRSQTEKRPYIVNMPADFMWLEADYSKVVYPLFNSPALVPQGDDFDNALGIIASARRPIILAGAGAIGAREQLIKLADRLEAPLATTLKAKGLFNGHPYNMDIFGTLSTPAAYEKIAQADCIVAFGASLHHFTTDRGKLLQGKRIVQINNSVSEVSKNLHPTVALVADAALTADNIIYWLDEAQIPASSFTTEIEPSSLHQQPSASRMAHDDGRIDYVYALEQLNKLLPAKRILTTDGGRFMTEVWCRVDVSEPRNFLVTAHFGSIGLGLAEAIGASFAAENLPTVLFSGDGGFMMGGINEFNTAVRLQRDLIVVICNDSAYGAEHIQFKDRNMDPSLSQFDWPSFARVAQSLGGEGVTLSRPEEIEQVKAAIENRTKPLLIELQLNPNEVPRMRI